jgi:predicted nucleic acid-binding protein
VFLYLDASAIVKLAIREPETSALESMFVHCRAAFSSKLSRLECTRAVSRAAGQRAVATLDQAFEALVLHEINDAVLARAGVLKPMTLRSLDAIHLATAMLLGLPDLSFVTYDEKLLRAAEMQGLSVAQPGRAIRRR